MLRLLLCLLSTVALAGEPVGLVNGSFEAATKNPELADGWTVSGDQTVVQQPRRERTPEGGWAQVLDCTALTGSGPASHAMLAQVDTLKLVKGQWYHFQMRVKAKDVEAGAVHVAISNTRAWTNCGLSESLPVFDDWTVFEANFQAKETISDKTRLQLWWHSTGTVWFADVQLEHVARPVHRMTEALPPGETANLIPNSSFEAGAAGWGSYTDLPGWGGNLNRLLGDVVPTGHSGGHALRIALDPQHLQTVWFDYYRLMQHPVRQPLAANRGWIGVTPGQPYTFSAWLRAAPAGLKAVLRAQQSSGDRAVRQVTVPGEWTRLEFTFTPRADQLYVCVGPDLVASGVDTGTLWIDDLQLEAGAAATAWQPRAAVEVGVRAALDGGLSEPGQRVGVDATVANQTRADRDVELTYTATDFEDRPLGPWHKSVHVAAGAAVTAALDLPAAGPGFYRVAVTAARAQVTPVRSIPLAVIRPNRRNDTVCGMNHGYPTQDLLTLSRRFGLGWFRDWSLKWEELEPRPGEWHFTGADAQIDRVRACNLHVLGLLPFPSAPWASSQPGAANQKTTDGVTTAVAAAPRDPVEFQNYVRRTVEHLKGRIDTFEIFNEPLYTGYSLPQKQGYRPADYVKWLDLGAAAVRQANPQAVVVGGLQCLPNDLTMEFIAAGGLKSIDAVSVHHYPGLARPETMIAPFDKLRAAMAAQGRADLPIYWTEGAYYAADRLPRLPYDNAWLTRVPTERLCAAYLVRSNAILCGHNVRRICYHSGTPGQINQESLDGIFFEYDGLPRKMTPAVATFNDLVGPAFRSRGALALDGAYGYVFDSDGRTVVIAWSLKPRTVAVDRSTWRVNDVMGRPVTGDQVTLTGEPVYLVAEGEGRSWR